MRNHGHGDHGPHDHSHHEHDVHAVGMGVVTVSSSRSLEEDPSGDLLVDLVESAGHIVATRELVGDSLDRVQSTVAAMGDREDVDVVITSGGTGVTPDDVTVEAVRSLFDKDLPGFGEVFRRRSEEEIGTRVIGTRAMAGVSDGTLMFCLPGSENAVRLGVEDIILKEVSHLVGLAHRPDDEEPGP